jgi:steroid 5-alpha reductase family enzyme
VTGLALFGFVIAVAFLVQWIAFMPAYLVQTERFYDLTGSLTYILVVTVALLLAPPPGLRSIVLWVLVVIWAVRLGTFLFARVRRAGKDARFDEIKPSFARFLIAWTMQGLWVSLTLAPALAAIVFAEEAAAATAPGGGFSADAFLVAGLLVWVAGFAIEVGADAQKRRFRVDSANEGRFISTGLWAWSRHPNYFGEIVLWTGMAIIAFPVLEGWQLATLVSPVFVYVLLTRISGVPLLERKADATWGGDAEYERYKAQTPVLMLRRPQ